MSRQPVGNSAREALNAWIRAISAVKACEDGHDRSLSCAIDRMADQFGAKLALFDDIQRLTYRDLSERSHQIGNWALAQGLGAGDTVCLLMLNCPDYATIWLGLTRIGCVVALLNTNLVGDALIHCILAASSKYIIAGSSFLEPLAAVLPRLPNGSKCWFSAKEDGGKFSQMMTLDVDPYPTCAPVIPKEVEAGDIALLIYTSGTTGLPKAAYITHARILEWSYWFSGIMNATPEDRLFNCLPMYHSIGGIVAIGSMLVAGGSVMIRQHFSASRFWNDLVDNQCTIFQYIGELCRYLVQTKPNLIETKHRLRLCCGNGLHADVWQEFQQRFNVPQILEFYAATEGNVSLYNCEGKPGAIGRVPRFLAHRFPIALIKCDPGSKDPVRGNDGLCVLCGPDETGEAIGKIGNKKQSAARHFDGYTDAQASEKKMLRNVFAVGDVWFRTGDLMRRDSAGFYYFVDRLGDTYRWKGENVSTTEVAAVISKCPGVVEAVVYGVAVPGHEGRAGMAAIRADGGFSFGALRLHVETHLPRYAQPLFIRICHEFEITGTFKLKKGDLQGQAYGPKTAPDTIWFNDMLSKQFLSCDDTLRRALNSRSVWI